jgi:uncharacterized membrane protein YczE
MSPVLRTSLHIVVLLMGIALMVGGIVTGKHGATVVGIIIAGVSVQQWMKWNKGRPRDNKNSSTP